MNIGLDRGVWTPDSVVGGIKGHFEPWRLVLVCIYEKNLEQQSCEKYL
jgi:hypothetical protein